MKNPYQEWIRHHDFAEIEKYFKQDAPIIGGFDVEATGLHIIKDRPFLLAFGWLFPNKPYGRVFVAEISDPVMQTFMRLAPKLRMLVAWNIKYDLHMLANIGFEYSYSNLVEGQALARVSVEAKSPRDGGDRLGLAEISSKYVHPLAVQSEKVIMRVKTQLEAEQVQVLTASLKQFPIEGETTPTGRPRYWGKGAIEKFLKDPTNDVSDLPPDIQFVWKQWQEEYPEVTYLDIYNRDPEAMIIYNGDDIINMLEYVRKALPVVKARNQGDVVARENRSILPFWRMERQGINTDQKYLKESQVRTKAYIIKQRKELQELAGEKVTVGQHVRLAQIIGEKWGFETDSSNKAHLNRILVNPEAPDDLKRFCTLIIELRSVEKWYATYILRVLRITSYDGRFYTQINQCGAVSGRVSSDAQQFPRGMMKDEEGNELYNPRKTFIPTNGKIVYVDQSQVELRQQASYTIQVSGGDLNLCRAYMPFKCTNKHTGKLYDYKDPASRMDWKLEDTWITEAGEPWKPTDVHSETSHNALVLLGYESLEKYKHYEHKEGKGFFGQTVNVDKFKEVRDMGKTVNFSKNYGVGLDTLCDMLDLPRHVGKALIEGYEKAFPHVLAYQQAIQRVHAKKGYIQNMYGRRYYLQDNRDAYKLANYGVQGTCADAVKEAIIEIDRFILENNLKSRLILQVHDELQAEIWENEDKVLVPKIQEELGKVKGCLVPVLADAEFTTTNWSETEKWVA